MRATILIEPTEHGHAAALWQDGQLSDLVLDGPDDGPPAPGTIFAATLQRPIKGLGGGGLVTLPDGQTGFLRDTKGLAPGARVLVQVSTYAAPGKSIPLVRRLLFKSRHAIVTPEAPGINIARTIRDEDRREQLLALAHALSLAPGHGLILRSACAEADPEVIADDISRMADLALAVTSDSEPGPLRLLDGPDAEEVALRDWPADADIFAEKGAFDRVDIWSEIDRLRRPRHALPGGAWMSIDPTPALVAVDVNTGKDTSAAAALKANRNAARDLPRALRLRGLGGQILIDFAPMSKAERREIETNLRKSLRQDPIETSLAGWSNLGLAELVRKRERRPLTEIP